MRQLPLGVTLRERARFATFYEGDNRQLLARLRHLAEGARGILWLHGALGCGRSHLLQAVCAEAPRALRVAYLPMLELHTAGPVVFETQAGFDVLVIDDVDIVIGQREFELALFAAYRHVEERGGALVLSAAAAPTAFVWAVADVASRYAAAEIFALAALDEPGQLQALRLRAADRGLELPEETARYLLRRFPRDMTSLGQLLDTIDVAALSAQRRLTVPFVREILDPQQG
jgi:DnaA family protein